MPSRREVLKNDSLFEVLERNETALQKIARRLAELNSCAAICDRGIEAGYNSNELLDKIGFSLFKGFLKKEFIFAPPGYEAGLGHLIEYSGNAEDYFETPHISLSTDNAFFFKRKHFSATRKFLGYTYLYYDNPIFSICFFRKRTKDLGLDFSKLLIFPMSDGPDLKADIRIWSSVFPKIRDYGLHDHWFDIHKNQYADPCTPKRFFKELKDRRLKRQHFLPISRGLDKIHDGLELFHREFIDIDGRLFGHTITIEDREVLFAVLLRDKVS